MRKSLVFLTLLISSLAFGRSANQVWKMPSSGSNLPAWGLLTTSNLSSSAGILGSQLSSSANIAGSQLSSSAGILGSQLSSSANITGSQLSSSANIAGSQLSSSANIAGSQLANGAVGTTQLANGGVTPVKLSSPNYSQSSSSGTFSTSGGGGYVSVVSTSLTASGSRPILARLDPDGSCDAGVGMTANASNEFFTEFTIDGTADGTQRIDTSGGGGFKLPASSFSTIFFAPSAGSHTFAFKIKSSNGGDTLVVLCSLLTVYEM